jgi:hypothetical protein
MEQGTNRASSGFVRWGFLLFAVVRAADDTTSHAGIAGTFLAGTLQICH